MDSQKDIKKNEENALYYPCIDKPFHQLFEEQVKRTPERTAVVYEDIRLTYELVNKKANQLAHVLKNKYPIKGDDIIALCLDRSEYILICMLAAMKTDGAYVPIDPSYPNERISYIMEDTRAKVILTNKKYAGRLSAIIPQEQLIVIEELFLNIQSPTDNLPSTINSKNLIYILYTSGTTGKPKGVMVEHRNLVSYCISTIPTINISAETRSIMVSDYNFSIINVGIFPVLLV